MAESQRSQLDRRFAKLKMQYEDGWKDVHQNIADYIQPRAGRFSSDDHNKGGRRDLQIIDNTATRANRTLSAGMMAGMTSPARPWFRLTMGDTDLMEFEPVKDWLYQVGQVMRRIFARSNTYNTLHGMYDELGAFATANSIMLQDRQTVVHHYPQTIGTYYLAQGPRFTVDTMFREFTLSVEQIVAEFGKDKVSQTVKSLYNQKNYDAEVRVRHAIAPRHMRDRTKRDKWNMPWGSTYWEIGAESDQLLSEGGFEEFACLTPRWDARGTDTYGRGPGEEALGDVMSLQFWNELKAKGAEYQGDPPVQVPSRLRELGHDLLPGGQSYYDDLGGQSGGIRTAFNVNLDLNATRESIIDIRERINSTFYADLFTMMVQSDRRQMTATEVAERHEEKLLMLGPVLERLHNEMLDPLIDRTFAIMVRTGILPPAPEEIQGQELRVEYVSMLAQAQRAVGVTAVDRLLGTVGAVAQFKPQVLDKLNEDELVDEYAEMLGVPPELILSGDQVALIRQDRAEREAAMAQAEAMPGAAQAAKTLSETDVESNNALTQMFTGV